MASQTDDKSNRLESWLLARSADLLRLDRMAKRGLVLLNDVFLCIAAIFVAFSLRVGALAFPLEPVAVFAAVAVPTFILIFYWAGVYGTIFRYAGGRTITQLAMAISVYALPLLAIFMISNTAGVPRTVAVIQPMIFFGFLGASRLVARHVLIDLLGSHRHVGGKKRVLIYGAGSAGQQLALSLRHDPAFILCGFVDDDRRLDKQRLDGVVIRDSKHLADVIRNKKIDTVLLALPRIKRSKRAKIVQRLRDLKVHVKTLPGIQQLVDGKVSIDDLREIRIEDLLGRDAVTPNELLLGRTIVGKTVMVTGAGGSIGSELCRQIVSIGAAKLILFELSEFALYAIEKELRGAAEAHDRIALEIINVLGSVTDVASVKAAFSQHKVDTVFHAAAYKHVPLVEANPIVSIRNNLIGTFEIARAAREAGVADFILISTDKAVRPTNVMGATKRAAEQVVQSFAAASPETRFSMVRFGNVLGSSGSVVPLFRGQIEAGGPITLTHKDVTRYFMTIPEAANLVIQAGGLAKGGEVFVLDMGKPMRIYDLARSMIELSGLTVRDDSEPDGDIAIREIGLRPGEKLYEELLIGERPKATKHPRIMMAHEKHLEWSKLQTLLGQLSTCEKPDQAIDLLATIVPEFEHMRDNDQKVIPRGA